MVDGPTQPLANIDDDKIIFEQRLVAFIDILGWSDAVFSAVDNAELRRRLHNAVSSLGAQVAVDVEDDTPEFPSSDHFSQFSDSVIISIPFSGDDDLLRLIKQIASYQSSMLMAGFPIRGGIAAGLIYHKAAIAFGPALNAAHRLESQTAKHPRVIIDMSLAPLVESASKKMPAHWPFVTRDTDGFYHPDYLTTWAMSDAASLRLDYMIETWLAVYQDKESVLKKYKWLASKWDDAKKDAGWRKEISNKIRLASP